MKKTSKKKIKNKKGLKIILDCEESKFISLMSDMTIKTLWVKGDIPSREFLNRIISNVVGFDVRKYTLFSNELGKESYKSLAKKVDILLVSPDKNTKINVELNKRFTKELINKNDSYILKIGGETYAGLAYEQKYSFSIRVIQVNINGFRSQYDTEFTINEYSLNNKKTNKERMGIKIYDISLPKDENSCYDISEELENIYLCLQLKIMKKWLK